MIYDTLKSETERYESFELEL